MALTIIQRPLAEVSKTLSSKTPIGSKLGTTEWQRNVPAALRDSAFLSAKVESARVLSDMQRSLQQILDLVRDAKHGGVAMDRSKFIAQTQQLANRLGLRATDPDKRGTLEDFGSERRLAEIYRQQIGAAQNKAYYLSGQDPDLLDAWPAQELIRVRASKVPRDWTRRWSEAGGKFYGGRMIALKTDQVWTQLSRFGRPYPPFDFNSGMGLQEIDREEAESLGLIQPGEKIEPTAERDLPAASVKNLTPEMREQLERDFGDQIEIVGDEARWRQGAKTPPLPNPKPAEPPLAPKANSLASTNESRMDAAQPLQPTGTPVSKAALIQGRTKKESAKIQSVLEEIDSVHGDGELLPIPVNNRISRKADGTYWSSWMRAGSIGVRKGSKFAESSLAHEFGHWIDHIGLKSQSGEKWASHDSNGLLRDWRAAIEKSEAFARLKTEKPSSYKEYQLSWHELWARSYAQFIAVESGNAAMLQQMRAILDGTTGFGKNSQWSDEDFAPIREEIRKVFSAQGWMK